jgi:hypothetical protein
VKRKKINLEEDPLVKDPRRILDEKDPRSVPVQQTPSSEDPYLAFEIRKLNEDKRQRQSGRGSSPEVRKEGSSVSAKKSFIQRIPTLI